MKTAVEKAADKTRAQLRTLDTLYRLLGQDVEKVKDEAITMEIHDAGIRDAAWNLFETASQLKRQAKSLLHSASNVETKKREEKESKAVANRWIHKTLMHNLQTKGWLIVTSEEGKYLEVMKDGVEVFFSVEYHDDDACHKYADCISMRVKKQEGESIHDYAQRAAEVIDGKWKAATGHLEPSLIVDPGNVEHD